MGRPNSVQITFRASEKSLLEAVEAAAQRTGKSRSRIVIEALKIIYEDRTASTVAVIDR